METLIINHYAVFTAAVANMAVGALWYSPALFFNSWKQEAGMTDEALDSANMGKIYTFGFLIALLIAYNLAAFLGDANTTASHARGPGRSAGRLV